MPQSTPMTASRLLILTLLTVSGAVVSATAASVYAAGDAARRLPSGALTTGRVVPLHAALLAAAADRTSPASLRLSVLDQIANGACFSTREMLFGASRRRHDAIDRAAAALSDVPDLEPLRQRHHAQLDAFSAGPPRSTTATGSVGVSMLRWLLPRTIEERVDYCRTLQ